MDDAEVKTPHRVEGGLDQAFCLVGSGRGRLSASLVEGFFG